jgi:hypothetical protein
VKIERRIQSVGTVLIVVIGQVVAHADHEVRLAAQLDSELRRG